MADSPSIVGHDAPSLAFHASFDVRKVNGDYKLVVILVEFTDVKHETSRDVIHDMAFTEMNEYWREVSYGQFNVIGDTVGWIDIGHNEAYYGKDTDPKDPGSDQRDPELIADACRLASGVDFSQYQDIMVVYAGHGQDSDPKDTGLLWPSAFMSGLDVTCGSKTFDVGGSVSEITVDGVLSVGGFTHEFGHTIGLPDLYDTGRSSGRDDYVGLWSLMADGSWGGPDDDGSSPTGLESWSRTKLGWLSSVPITLTSVGFVQAVKQIGELSGPRALKLAAQGGDYYLIEVRQRSGVDEYLPDSGVLISRIDESKDSGEGVVKIMDCHPETRTLNDATCKLNDSWSDNSHGVYVKVIGKQGASYVVAVANTPIAKLDIYTAQLSLLDIPSSASTTVTVDGVEYDTFTGNQYTLMFPVGSTHIVTLSQYVMIGNDTRYYAADNTVTIRSQDTYTFNYLKQNRLLIQTPTGETEGWFAPDETATIGPYDQIIPVDSGTRFSLVSFVVDGIAQGKMSVTLPMDQPHVVKVNYATQYLLKIDSSFGDPKGEGWYHAGDEARYSVTSPYGLLVQHVFVSWTGDIASSEPHGTLTMTRPYVIRANWREDYTQLIMLIIVSMVIAGVVALWAIRRRKPTPSSLAQELRAAQDMQTRPLAPAPRWCISCGRQILRESVFCELCGVEQPDSP